MKQTIMSGLAAEQEQPPMGLDLFIRLLGITRKTAWTWRKAGALRTVNIYGRVYVPAKEVAEFNRRAAAGEFQKNFKPPQRAAPRAARSGALAPSRKAA